jgi:hypothetical protein
MHHRIGNSLIPGLSRVVAPAPNAFTSGASLERASFRNATSLVPWKNLALSSDLSRIEAFIKTIALALLAGQVILYVGAIVTHVMLHGDGSYFVYTIAAGAPWDLKWKYLLTRSSIYILTVVPAEFFSSNFRLSGEQIAAVNAATFYGIQLAQYLILLILAWRQFPQLLIFPILQYGLSTGIGFGFPSEILLAPGFFWICMFALIRTPVPWFVVSFAFTGLVFSHELAVPSALLVVAFAWRRHRQMDISGALGLQLLYCFATLGLWLIVRLNGGGNGADHTAIYVFDPRRVLNDPTLWLITAAVVTIVLISRTRFARHRHFFWVIGFAFFFLTVLAGSATNFAQGRYDSARTLTGLWMAILGLVYLVRHARSVSASTETASPNKLFVLKSLIVGVLSVNLAASLVFLHDWNESLLAFSRAVNTDPGTGKMEIVSGDPLEKLISPTGRELTERMGFSWTWPYRSIVVAKGFRPGHVLLDPDEALAQCGALSFRAPSSHVPADLTKELSRFLCAQPASHDRRYFRHWLLRQLGWDN